MRAVVALEERFVLREGRPASALYSYDRFWKRYLDGFERVTILGRLEEREDSDSAPIEGPGVEFFPLPGYRGPRAYLRQRGQLLRRVSEVYTPEAAYLLRVPGMVGNLLWTELRRRGHPYAVEVVGDPWDVYAPGTSRHPLRPFFRSYFTRLLRRQCREALAASYVTADTLQRRYPPAPGAFTTHYSSIELPASALVAEPHAYPAAPRPLRLVNVGSMFHLQKAPDVVLQAMARCVGEGLDLVLTLLGDGPHRPELEELARELGLEQRVRFTGNLPVGEAVFAELDGADLFVLPSRQEGLPRSMIEAMARGLPCVGSTVGGIPELLPAEDLVPPGEVKALAVKLRELAADPARLTREAARNLAVARDYRSEVLQARRAEFYAEIRRRTEAWLAGRGPG